MVSLVGRNGAGKTTLMRSIMGHLKLAQGEVRFEGADLSARPRHARVARDRLYAGRPLPSASIDGRRKHHVAVVGLATSRPQGPARLRL
ncbi:ATP-binding cassette domain-containing protein [Bradyrhizobium sp. TZ2]